MSEPLHRFSSGDRVRVSARCFDAKLHGIVGIISPKTATSVNSNNERVVWVEFDPWVQPEDGHPIEAAEVDVDDLDPIP